MTDNTILYVCQFVILLVWALFHPNSVATKFFTGFGVSYKNLILFAMLIAFIPLLMGYIYISWRN